MYIYQLDKYYLRFFFLNNFQKFQGFIPSKFHFLIHILSQHIRSTSNFLSFYFNSKSAPAEVRNKSVLWRAPPRSDTQTPSSPSDGSGGSGSGSRPGSSSGRASASSSSGSSEPAGLPIRSSSSSQLCPTTSDFDCW